MTHGDLKPSNLMLDPRTGVVKIIDLGASRRFVHLSNRERNNRCAVEEQDRHALSRGRPLTRLAPELCEGLGSLTGSPYYMAPEILLQATRYVDASGRARSVLEDYEFDYPSFLAREQWPMYQIGLSDLRRGWGIRADIWSWACTVQALLLKTVEEDQRPSSSTISPYDFSFSRHRDEMIDPLYEKASGEDDVPRFHQWCRVLPLLIVRIALEPVPLIQQADGCSAALRSALKASLRHQDLRPTADDIQESLEAARPSTARLNGRPQTGSLGSSRRSSYEKSKRHSVLGTPSDASASPRMNGSELDHSRYTTPTLSHGTSSVSTPQHTCEMGGKSGAERTPDRDRKSKVRFDTNSADSAFFPAPSLDSHLSEEAKLGVEEVKDVKDTLPQGFELVSPTRPPKLRSTTFGEAPRPSTANASIPSFGGSSRIARPSRAVTSAGKAAKSHPSTPTASVRELTSARPGTSPRMGAGALGRGFQGSKTSHFDRRPLQELPRSESLTPSAAGGLGITWPLEGLRGLQLNGPAQEARAHREAESVPSSPMAHVRGASMPLFMSETAGHSSVMVPSLARLNGDDIGGSPRSTVADGKHGKQNSLMATLKEKQVRLKQSSRRLMSKRGSGASSSAHSSKGEAGTDPYGARSGAIYVSESEAFGQSPVHAGHMRMTPNAYAGHDAGMATPDYSSRSSSIHNASVRNRGSSNRRSGNKSGSDGSPSKPLLRRLLTWSTTS